MGRAEAPADNTAIPYLWARTKVERLTDYGTREDVQDAVRQAMIEKNSHTAWTGLQHDDALTRPLLP